jgi:hypothetical protein
MQGLPQREDGMDTRNILHGARSRFFERRGKAEAPRPETQLLADMRDVRRQLENCSALFASETDEDLLDAAIYQMKALRARYDFLLRQAREQKLQVAALPIQEEETERWIN